MHFQKCTKCDHLNPVVANYCSDCGAALHAGARADAPVTDDLACGTVGTGTTDGSPPPHVEGPCASFPQGAFEALNLIEKAGSTTQVGESPDCSSFAEGGPTEIRAARRGEGLAGASGEELPFEPMHAIPRRAQDERSSRRAHPEPMPGSAFVARARSRLVPTVSISVLALAAAGTVLHLTSLGNEYVPVASPRGTVPFSFLLSSARAAVDAPPGLAGAPEPMSESLAVSTRLYELPQPTDVSPYPSRVLGTTIADAPDRPSVGETVDSGPMDALHQTASPRTARIVA